LSDPEGRPTVAELLEPVGVRVVPVGRLDFHTSGALLCTNDGEFANALAHPRNKAKKVYVAKVQGLVHDEQLEQWRKSIEIDGRATAPAEVRRLRFEGDKTWLELTLREGRNRQVRRLGEATGSLVMRLARISHAGITAEDLRPGQWRHLSLDELIVLKRDFGVPHRVRAPGTDAWEIQVKANAKVPRVAVAKRAEDPHARQRREAGAGNERPRARSAEPRVGDGDRFERPSNARPAGQGRPGREAAPRAERAPERSNARPERSNARPERSNARPERSNGNPRDERTGSGRSEARPAQRPRDAAAGARASSPAGRISSRGARESSRRRGT
jgi:23S rRNA pseudouridine2605 synthase